MLACKSYLVTQQMQTQSELPWAIQESCDLEKKAWKDDKITEQPRQEGTLKGSPCPTPHGKGSLDEIV